MSDRSLSRVRLLGRTGWRLAPAALVVVVAALVAATIWRPATGYRDLGELLSRLGEGAGVALVTLFCLGVVAQARTQSRGGERGSLGQTITSGIVLVSAVAVLIVAAAAIELWPRASAPAGSRAALSEFTAWQHRTIPLVLAFSSAARVMLISAEHPGAVTPRRARRTLAGVRQLDRIATASVGEVRRYGRSTRLGAVARMFERAAILAQGAGVELRPFLRLRERSGAGPLPASMTRSIRKARAELRSAQVVLQRFSLSANALGSQLTGVGPQ